MVYQDFGFMWRKEMKYDNLLRFLLTYCKVSKYGDVRLRMAELMYEDSYLLAINNKHALPGYKEKLMVARKEYLEYIREEETSVNRKNVLKNG